MGLQNLKGKRVVLGVCGSISAYKSAALIRLLVKAGAQVRVVMTPGAHSFITPLTLSTLSKNLTLAGFVDKGTNSWNDHVEIAGWADVVVIAPATCRFLSQLASGLCEHLLLGICLSAKVQVFVAPAMDADMFRHFSTRKNIDTLTQGGVKVLPSPMGELASGMVGEGRLAEPHEILEQLALWFGDRDRLKGVEVMITSGPTREDIDKVRYVGNYSSGKMGKSLAGAFGDLGAGVTFISGPAAFLPDRQEVRVVPVVSASQMYQAALDHHDSSHICVFCAAVADYRPERVIPGKKKRVGAGFTLSMVENPDIAMEMGKRKKKQYHVGFALEDEDERKNALRKMKEKNFDLVVLNSLRDHGAGFSHDTNKVTVFDRKGEERQFPLGPKDVVGREIVSCILQRWTG